MEVLSVVGHFEQLAKNSGTVNPEMMCCSTKKLGMEMWGAASVHARVHSDF